MGINATIDFGLASNVDPSAAASVKAKVRITGTSTNLTWSNGVWSAPDGLTVLKGAGAKDVSLDWAVGAGTINGQTCSNPNNPFAGGNKCQGTFTNVQRTFGGDDTRSGPLRQVQVLDLGGTSGINSLRQCDAQNLTCTYKLAVRISVQPTLQVAKSSDPAKDPVVTLRDGSNNQPGTINCDPAISNLRDQIARRVPPDNAIVHGCAPSYKANLGTTCPDKTALWASAQPWTCAVGDTGAAVGQVIDGFNLLILGDTQPTSCSSPNRFAADFGHWDPGDPRVVQVMLTSFGAFSGSGTTTVPVTGFATFYVTGWNDSSGKNPCQGNGDDPAPKGGVVGHFISYVETQGGTPSPDSCDPNSVMPCIGVLTR
jgi:hypothetical protein